MAAMGDVLLIRHGETEWSRSGQHTGRTDLPLTGRGERQSAALVPLLAARPVVAAFCSPLQRATRTASLAGLSVTVLPALVEWDNGDYEGRTTEQVRQDREAWWLWTDGAPGGESWEQVQPRCEQVLSVVEPLLSGGDVALVGHGHALRALTAVWLGLPAYQGGLFTQEPASLGVLGSYHGHRVVKAWGLQP
jgi:broad specificity phosphatase PhoE